MLKDKNIIITGAGRGIGKAVAIACAKEGANVGLTSRTLEQLIATREEIISLETDVKCVVKAADITKLSEVVQTFAGFYEELGQFNGVIANAGASWRANAHEVPIDKFEMVINTNILGVFYTFRAAFPYLQRQNKDNKARFIITGSAVYPSVMGGFSSYTASKYGIVGLQRELATEYKKENILVNMILPMQVDTKLLRGRKAGDGNKPPGVLDPTDLIDYYLFALSEQANRINDELIYPSNFEALKMIIREAPEDQKQDWAQFKQFLKEKSPNLFKNIKKLSELGEFILNRLK
jgi:3-oxoacyl-[acyl-carrier protein] reductase